MTRQNISLKSSEVPKPLSRREREKEKRRQDILEAAEEVFAAKSFHGASIDEVAERAEFAKGTIYLYFKSKEALYSALFENKTERMLGMVRDAVRAASSFPEKLTALVGTQLRFAEQNAWFFRIFTQERMDVGDGLKRENWARVYSLYTEFLTFMADVIALGQKEKHLRPGDTERYALTLLGVVNITIRSWLERKDATPLADETSFIVDFFLAGAGMPVGPPRSQPGTKRS